VARCVNTMAAATAVLIFVAGVAWAKWLPHADKASALGQTHTWDGTAMLGAGYDAELVLGWSFATAYAEAVWRHCSSVSWWPQPSMRWSPAAGCESRAGRAGGSRPRQEGSPPYRR
jgi:hypothetical protein